MSPNPHGSLKGLDIDVRVAAASAERQLLRRYPAAGPARLLAEVVDDLAHHRLNMEVQLHVGGKHQLDAAIHRLEIELGSRGDGASK